MTSGPAWRDRVERPVRVLLVPLRGRVTVIALKRRTGQPKDRADPAALGALSRSY